MRDKAEWDAGAEAGQQFAKERPYADVHAILSGAARLPGVDLASDWFDGFMSALHKHAMAKHPTE